MIQFNELKKEYAANWSEELTKVIEKCFAKRLVYYGKEVENFEDKFSRVC